MTNNQLNREENVQAVFDLKAGYTLGLADVEILKRVARIALAAMDTEPVAYIPESQLDLLKRGVMIEADLSKVQRFDEIPLYRHAQPVPDDYKHLRELYHAQEKRLFKIAQRIKGPSFDKYAHSPSQAIDVLEATIFGEDDACRAAMLQAGNSPVIPEGYVMVPKEPTEAMCDISHISVDVYCGITDDNEYYSIGGAEAAKVWKAMLAAAPQEVKP
ncbi:TPA: hypothetical protein NPM58_001636 [Klebsiella pneumoniae]|nr:hypothetical protein EAO22_21815 [Klebsiella pneumoniae]HCI5529693.1 hypothetical protein [Klebsiella pneumoniae]HCI5544434.1 hypothetical protein [Klebsiella pneumoniae]